MLNTVGAPLVLRYLSEHNGPLVQELVDNAVLRTLLEVFEGVLLQYLSVYIDCTSLVQHTCTTSDPVS